MQILVNSDKNIPVDMQFKRFAREEAKRVLTRFQSNLTRVEFHLSDVNAAKFGRHDKRCMTEARPAGHKPLTVTAAASTAESAVRGSLSKLRSKLTTFFGRLKPQPARIRRTLRAAARKAVPKEAAAPARKQKAGTIPAKPAKKAAARTVNRRKPPAAWRGPKKKHIYHARRKFWPSR